MNKDWTKDDNFNEFLSSKGKREKRNLIQNIIWFGLLHYNQRILSIPGNTVMIYKKRQSDNPDNILAIETLKAEDIQTNKKIL